MTLFKCNRHLRRYMTCAGLVCLMVFIVACEAIAEEKVDELVINPRGQEGEPPSSPVKSGKPVKSKIRDGPKIGDECPAGTRYPGDGAEGSDRYCLYVEQKAFKRCETSYFNYLKRDSDTTIRFDFRLDTLWDFHDDWTSIFQVHSAPDPGEQWRCPVSSLVVVGHRLTMWDRYDLTPISTTVNGTCADNGNSIHGRDVFADVPVEAGKWNSVELRARFSLDQTGSFAVRLNDKEVGSFSGPNTFNDQRQPFVKFGIYKPSTWRDAKKLCVDYRNISITHY
jgi:Polysaccharide lyase